MRVERLKDSILCEFGACSKEADYVITFEGMSPYSNLYICGDCLKHLENAIKKIRKKDTVING